MMQTHRNVYFFGIMKGLLVFLFYLGRLSEGYATPPEDSAKVVKEITGVVKNQEGNPVVGANVIVKGTTVATITNEKGEYKIRVPEDKNTLLFSSINYAMQEVEIQTKTTINIVLQKQSLTNLENLIAIGYGKTNKKKITGSITSLKRKDFNQGIISDPDQLIQGKIAGLSISRSGDPNGTPSGILRGPSTLRSGQAQEPFYVIDGVPGASVNLIAPDDIVSIEVLKDASATAIYGARAANGVIIISTNDKERGHQSFSYATYVGLDRVSNKLDLLSGDELRSYLTTHGLSLNTEDDDGSDTDWQDEVTRTGISHNHTFMFNGTRERYSFSGTVNYFQQEGIMKGSSKERVLGRVNLENSMLNNKLKLGFTLYGSSLNRRLISQEVFYQMLHYLPTVGVYQADGSYSEDLSRVSYFNPAGIIKENWEDQKINTLLANPRIHLEPFKGFSYDLSLSLQDETISGGEYNTSLSSLPDAQRIDGNARRYVYENTKHILENYITFQHSFVKHDLKVLAGYSWQEDRQGNGFQTTAQGFVSDALGYNNLDLANLPEDYVPDYGNAGTTTLRLISFFGRLNYIFDNTLFFQASLRRDGSSAFGGNNQWGTFPAVSAAWQISNMDFMNLFHFVNDLKLRIGYGVSGNSLGFDPYISILRYGEDGAFYYNGQFISAIGPVQNANPDLQWENTGMLNVGLDFSLWQGRINGTVEYYNKRTSNLIWNYSVPSTVYPANSGVLTANVGEMSNKGVEITLSANILKIKDFSWNVTANFFANKNKLESLSDEQFQLDEEFTAFPRGLGQSGVTVQIIKEGYPIGQFYTLEYLGKNEGGISQFRAMDGSMTTTPTIEDRTFFGNAQADFLYGLNSTITWKKLDFNFFLRGVYGNEIFNATLADLNFPGTTQYNIPAFTLREPVTDNIANTYSNRYIEDGSYLRLDNMTLGYTLPIRSEYIKRLRIYIGGQNLFVITNYRGIDPEVNLGGFTPGFDNKNYYPKTRAFLVGAQVKF